MVFQAWEDTQKQNIKTFSEKKSKHKIDSKIYLEYNLSLRLLENQLEKMKNKNKYLSM